MFRNPHLRAPNRAYRIVGDFVCVLAGPAAEYSTSCRRNSSEVEHGANSTEGQARRALARDSGRSGWEIGGGKRTAEESPPAGHVTDETDHFRLADNPTKV
jgi:hypothetical protein